MSTSKTKRTKRASEPLPKQSKKRRTSIPQTVADEVMIESDRTCCVCRRAASVQIHHLNETPSDHRIDNLAVLCFECHEETQLTGGFGRKLRDSEVRIARDEWYEIVRRKKETGLPRPELFDSIEFTTVLDAVAVVRIREIGLAVAHQNSLKPLNAFTNGFGPRVASEALEVLSRAALSARESAENAECLGDLVRAFLPIHSLMGRRYQPLSPEERELLIKAEGIGRDIAYHAARRSHDLGVLNAGGRILWSILRFAVLNDDVRLRESEATFDELKRWCEESKFDDGKRWLTFLVEDATQVGEFTGVYPAKIAAKLALRH